MKAGWIFPALAVAAGCATLANDAGDIDAVRPNSHAGPFRALRDDEVPSHDGPYLLKGKLNRFRDATAVDLEQRGAPGQTAMYALATVTSQLGVFRFLSDDARAFDETPAPGTPVLAASEPWEGTEVEAPEAAEIGGAIWLFYSAAEGIGAASSTDGASFQKIPGPILAVATSGWDAGLVPRAPTIVVAGGEYRMFYEAGGRIGEARSSDGAGWERMGDTPVLEPRAITDPAEPPFDSDSLGDPEAWVAPNAEGKLITRVYYTGRLADGTTAIGMAARFGNTGTLTRAVAPSFSGQRAPYAPAILAYPELTLLYLTERAELSEEDPFPAVAGAVAPGDVKF